MGYEFLKELGKGGTSKVDLVLRKSDGRRFALKRHHVGATITPDSESATSQSFGAVVCRELEITSHLNHPSVIRVTPVKPDAPECGLLMSPVCGRPLNEATMPMSPVLLREILSALAMTLYYLELKSVVHGDIKPHNIFFPAETLEESFDHSRLFFPRLIDFSMGLRTDEPQDKRLGMGTLGYSAPETVAHEELTPQSDLFSLGVVAYYLACGRHPFLEDTDDPAAIAAAVREYSPPRLDKELEGFPASLAKLIDSLLAKEPALRPKNGFALCEALEKQGAQYPFRKAVQPRHLLPQSIATDVEALGDLPGFNLPSRNYLHRISDGDVRKIRIILDANFRSQTLIWSEGVISAAVAFHEYLWPKRLRQWEQKEFAGLTLTEAKWLVRCAVAGDAVQLLQILQPPSSLRPGIATSSLVEVIRGNLSQATIKTQSCLLAKRMADGSREDDSLELLATLYFQAENITECASVAFKYCESLKSENRQIEALPLLHNVAELAERLQEKKLLLESLHRDADIRRDSGDMNGAELRYKRIVELCDSERTPLLAETYKDLGDLYKLKQDYDSGLAALSQAEILYREFDDTAELARVTNNKGNIFWIASRYKEALKSYRQALKLRRKQESLPDVASIVNNIASIYAVTGRSVRAVHLYSLSLVMKRQLNNLPEVARTLNNLGYTYFLQGNLTAALEALEESLNINEEVGSKKEIITNLDNFVSCAILAGRFSDAVSHIRQGRELAEELHDGHSKAIFDANLARVFLRTGQWDHALRLAQRSASKARELSDKTLLLGCLLVKAELYNQMQLVEKSAACAQEATNLAEEIGDKQAQVQCALVHPHSAVEHLQEALQLANETKSVRDIALCELALAERHLRAGETDRASVSIGRAAGFFEDVTEDVDLLRFWRVWSEIRYSQPDITQIALREIYARLLKIDEYARTQSECYESWKVEIVQAEVGSRCGEYEGSYAALMHAMQSIKKLAEVLPDKDCVRAFTRQPFMSRMSAEIMRLKAKLNVE